MTSLLHGARPSAAAVALACCLLPIATVHLSYGLSVWAGIVPGCIPYLEGCTSISATGRHGAGYVLFKAGMLPAAVAIALYWRLCRDWLRAAGDTSVPALRSVLALGIAAALFLVLYTVFLGHKGPVYDLLRRFGVSLHLGLTLLAQLVLVWRLQLHRGRGPRPAAPCPEPLLRAKTALVTVLLLLGLGSIPVSNFVVDKDPIENAIEWTFCLLLSLFYGLTAVAWRRTGYGTVAA